MEDVVRNVVLMDDGYYAVVARYGVTSVAFALPPDSEPTGRLWARLEKRLEGWMRDRNCPDAR
jgi:hypothetical protein